MNRFIFILLLVLPLQAAEYVRHTSKVVTEGGLQFTNPVAKGTLTITSATASRIAVIDSSQNVTSGTSGVGITNVSGTVSGNYYPGSNVTFSTNSSQVTISATGGSSGSSVFIDAVSAPAPNFSDSGNLNFTLTGTNVTGTIQIASEAQGDLLYRNATVWTRLAAGTSGLFLQTRGASANPVWVNITNHTTISCSSLTVTLQSGNSVGFWRAPYAATITDVRGSLLTAGSTGTTVDINKNGSTILSTKLTFDSSEKTTVTAAVPYVLSSTALADDDELTFDVDTAGTGAVGLQVKIYYTRP